MKNLRQIAVKGLATLNMCAAIVVMAVILSTLVLMAGVVCSILILASPVVLLMMAVVSWSLKYSGLERACDKWDARKKES